MNKKMNKKKIVTYVLGVMPLLMILLTYQKLPDLVPMQWNGSGVSRYGNKSELFLVGAVSLAVVWLLPLLRRIDPRRVNYEKFSGVYETIILFLAGLFSILTALTLVESLSPGAMPTEKLVMILVGVLLLVLGNLMPKVRSNFFLGFKTPWSLSSEAVWHKTHRLGGKVFFFGGLLIIVCAVFLPSYLSTFAAVAFAVAACFVPAVMSYVWYRQENKERISK